MAGSIEVEKSESSEETRKRAPEVSTKRSYRILLETQFESRDKYGSESNDTAWEMFWLGRPK